MIRMPRLLDSTGKEVRRLNPESISLDLKIVPLSYARMQLPQDENIPFRSWVEVFTEKGSAGIFRSKAPQEGYGDISTETVLEHGITELGDYLVREDYEESMSLRNAMVAMFSHYEGSHWQLGEFSASESVVVNIDNGSCTVLEAMLTVLSQAPSYMMDFNFGTTPWTVYVRKRETTPSAEGRLSRNLKTVTVTRDDDQLCTRGIIQVTSYEGSEESHEWIVVNADTISTYGVVERNVAEGNDYTYEQAQAVCNAYVQKHKHPRLSVDISGIELCSITGENLDTFNNGKMMSLNFPDRQENISEVIVSLYYNDLIRNPLDVTVTLSEEDDNVMETLRSESKAARSSARRSNRKINHLYYEFYSEDGYLHSQFELNEQHLMTVFEDMSNSLRGEFEVTASHLRTEFQDADNALASEFEVTASHLRAEFMDADNNLRGEFDVTASHLRTEFQDANNNLRGEFETTASHLRTEFQDADNALVGEFEVTASHLRAEFNDADNWLRGEFEATATHLRAEFTDADNQLQSEFELTASRLRTEFEDADSNLQSQFEVTASSLRAEFENADANLRAGINAQADRIGLVIEGTGANAHIKPAQIIAAINAQTGQSSALISADKISMDGRTTINDVIKVLNSIVGIYVTTNFYNGSDSSGVITVGNGRVSSPAFRVYLPGSTEQYYELNRTNMPLMLKKAEVDPTTNTLKIWRFEDPDSTPSITFSKAASVTALTGSWSGGTLTVVTNPDSGHSFVNTPSLALNGNGTDSFSAEMSAVDSAGTTAVRSRIYGYLRTSGSASSTVVNVCKNNDGTGVVGSISVGNLYTDGKTAGNNEVTINKGSWSAGQISFTKSKGTASTKTVQLTAAATTWNGNTGSRVIWDGTAADAQHGVSTGYTVSVDASSRYTAGWNDFFSQSWYVPSDTPPSGYASGKFWVPNTKTSASDPLSYQEWTRATNAWNTAVSNATASGIATGKNAVTINKGSWSNGQISFTKSEGTSSTKTVQLTAATATWNGNVASRVIWDGTAADAQHGVSTGYTVSVDATSRYNEGWGVATGNVYLPTEGYNTTFNVTYPSPTVGQTITRTFEITTGSPSTSGYAAVTLKPVSGSGGTVVGRISIGNWYTSGYNQGWGVATGNVYLPLEGYNTTFTVTYPSPTVGETITRTFEITKGSPSSSGGYAAVTLLASGSSNGRVVGRISIGDWYTSGYNQGWGVATGNVYLPTEGYNTTFTVTYPSPTVGETITRTFEITKGTPSSSGYASVTLKPTSGSGGTVVGRIDISNWYTSGYDQGWGVATGNVYLPTAGTDTTFTVTYPSPTVGETITRTFEITKGSTPGLSGYASVTLKPTSGSGGTVVGRIDISNWYSSGYVNGWNSYVGENWYIPGDTLPGGTTSNQFYIPDTRSTASETTTYLSWTRATNAWNTAVQNAYNQGYADGGGGSVLTELVSTGGAEPSTNINLGDITSGTADQWMAIKAGNTVAAKFRLMKAGDSYSHSASLTQILEEDVDGSTSTVAYYGTLYNRNGDVVYSNKYWYISSTNIGKNKTVYYN